MTPDPDNLEGEIARGEARLAELKREEGEVRARLREQRVGPGCPQADSPRPPAGMAARPATPAEKIRLFRSLFRGRGDVFPRLWINARKGKKGWAPLSKDLARFAREHLPEWKGLHR